MWWHVLLAIIETLNIVPRLVIYDHDVGVLFPRDGLFGRVYRLGFRFFVAEHRLAETNLAGSFVHRHLLLHFFGHVLALLTLRGYKYKLLRLIFYI